MGHRLRAVGAAAAVGLRRAPLLAAGAIVLALTACGTGGASSPTATATQTPPPEPTATAEPEVTSIVIGGSEFTTVLADGTAHDTVPYASDPAAAISLLTGLFDQEPVVTGMPEQHCSPSFTRADWSGAVKLDTEFAWLPEGQLFDLVVTQPSLNGIEIVSTIGLRVGDDAGAVIAGLPPQQVELYELDGVTTGAAAYEVEGGKFAPEGYDAWGAQLLIEGSAVDGIASPIVFLASSTC